MQKMIEMKKMILPNDQKAFGICNNIEELTIMRSNSDPVYL